MTAGEQTRRRKISQSLREQYANGTRAKVRLCGTASPQWKGDNIGYRMIHRWLKQQFGQPTICENCDKYVERGSEIHWANKSGKYKRDRGDWMRLCMSCHMIYDFKVGQRKSVKKKLVADQVLAIRKDSRPKSEIAKHYGISPSTVKEIQNRLIWKEL